MILAPATLIGLSALCAALLRWARVPGNGWSILGGVMAGILLGPAILGRVAPVLYERSFIGGIEQRQSVNTLISRQGADALVARHAGWNAQQLQAMVNRHSQEQLELQQQWSQAKWRHQSPLRIIAAILIGILLLAAWPLQVTTVDDRQGWTAPINIGLWSAAFPGLLAYAAMTWWWRFPPHQAAMVASAIMVGPWAITGADRLSADQVEVGGARMVQTAGRVSSLLACGLATWSMHAHRGYDGLASALPLLCLPIGWLLSLPISTSIGNLATRGMYSIVIPSLAALAMIRVDLFAHIAFWPLIVVFALSGDGRWAGACFGAIVTGGRSVLRVMRLVMSSMAAGPTQLAITALAAQARALPEQLILPLLLGAALMEVSLPARRAAARLLVDIEERTTDE